MSDFEMQSMQISTLNCPHCGGDKLHITEVRVTQGPNRLHVYHGNLTEHVECESTDRGSSIQVDLVCEERCYSTLTLYFHKGSVRQKHEANYWDHPDDLKDIEFWRD